MDVRTNKKNCKIVVGCLMSVLMMFSMTANCIAADFKSLRMYPENVGVFTSVNKQQFVAYGVTSDGSIINITKRVNWESSNESIVTISDDGVASVVPGKTYGQVKISCSYPKTGSGTGPGVNLLLLN